MSDRSHSESPHVALLKSAATKVAADDNTAVGERLIEATDNYVEHLERGEVPTPPPSDGKNLEVETYLAYLHHRKAHGKISDNSAVQADLEEQLRRFTYGNPKWQQMFVEYVEYYWQYPFHTAQAPIYRSWKDAEPNGDINFGVIDWQLPADATVAIIGDIGTGTDVAAAALIAAMSFEPDAILHMGDVYFSGTEFEMQRRYVDPLKEVFQSVGRQVPVFGVPGNHEYFTGAVPYLNMLDSGALAVERSQRQQASYFSLRTEDNGWQFQGIDTGFHGHYMDAPKVVQQTIADYIHDGEIGVTPSPHPEWPQGINPHFNLASGENLPFCDPTKAPPMVRARSDEVTWHRHHINTFPGRSLLLSHHQLYSTNQVCGIAQSTKNGELDPVDRNRIGVNTELWRQFGSHFGSSIAGWIWGHEHNLVIYEDNFIPAGWPPSSSGAWRALPKGRCAGHTAIPVATSSKPYERKHPVAIHEPEIRLDAIDGWFNRGFEILELAGSGKPAQLTFYQLDGADPTPHQLFSEQIH